MGICSGLNRTQSNRLYLSVLAENDTRAMRELCKEDLFFLLTIALKRQDVNREWLYERCREVEEEPNGFLDLWAREHYKSTIITYAKNIQEILRDPNVTIGIFSHTKGIANAFLSQIKEELESNAFLQDLFPDILYKDPKRESKCWSIQNGIQVKRSQNPKEATVEAWGLVDGQPTSKHFSILCYDDVVTRESVNTPEMIERTTLAWELSLNLGAEGGSKRYIGTRYHYNDTYKTIIEREAAIPRLYPATHDGTIQGTPVFMSQESLDIKRKSMGPYTFGSQMLQDPVADKAMGFRREWIVQRQFTPDPNWNYYIVVDPAGEKKKTNDYTVMAVIGLAPDSCYYLVDGIRDRLNLTERAEKLFNFVRKWKPLNVGYEKYGLQSDIEHFEFCQQLENFRFRITPLGGSTSKNDRIRKLVPPFENMRFVLPHRLIFIDSEGKAWDFVKLLIDDEFMAFPVAVHDDMMDCISRIMDKDLNAKFPMITGNEFSFMKNGNTDTTNNEYEVL